MPRCASFCRVRICDIKKTYNDPFATNIRKGLRRKGFSGKLTVVFSDEPIQSASLQLTDQPYKQSYYGTISYIPALFGLQIAAHVINSVIDNTIGSGFPAAPKQLGRRSKSDKEKVASGIDGSASGQQRRHNEPPGIEGVAEQFLTAESEGAPGGSAGVAGRSTGGGQEGAQILDNSDIMQGAPGPGASHNSDNVMYPAGIAGKNDVLAEASLNSANGVEHHQGSLAPEDAPSVHSAAGCPPPDSPVHSRADYNQAAPVASKFGGSEDRSALPSPPSQLPKGTVREQRSHLPMSPDSTESSSDVCEMSEDKQRPEISRAHGKQAESAAAPALGWADQVSGIGMGFDGSGM